MHRAPGCAACLPARCWSLLAACSKPAAELPRQAIDVTVMTVAERDTPVDFEFTAQTQSSREVEIRARVDGFLDKRVYTEGQLVHAGQTLFLMDPKPFEAVLQSAKGQLAQQQARLTVAKANLARVVPLVAQNALSQKERDDAIGSEKEAEAAVIAAKGQVQTARAQPELHDDQVPAHGSVEFRPAAGWQLRDSGRNRPAYHCVPARSDVGELQHFRERVVGISRPDREKTIAVSGERRF